VSILPELERSGLYLLRHHGDQVGWIGIRSHAWGIILGGPLSWCQTGAEAGAGTPPQPNCGWRSTARPSVVVFRAEVGDGVAEDTDEPTGQRPVSQYCEYRNSGRKKPWKRWPPARG